MTNERRDAAGRVPGARTEAWSRVGTLVTTQGKPNRRIVSLSKTFPHPGTYTLQFHLKPADPDSHQIIECEAVITWGAGGNTVRRVVTVVDGLSITGIADSVRVVMRDVSSVLGSSGDKYVVSVQIAPGTRPTTQPPLLYPPLSSNPQTVAAGGSADFNVPQDSGCISVCVIAGNASAVAPAASIPEQEACVIQSIIGFGVILKKYDARMFEFVPLSPGCRVVRFSNLSTGIMMRVQVAFAIDG